VDLNQNFDILRRDTNSEFKYKGKYLNQERKGEVKEIKAIGHRGKVIEI